MGPTSSDRTDEQTRSALKGRKESKTGWNGVAPSQLLRSDAQLSFMNFVESRGPGFPKTLTPQIKKKVAITSIRCYRLRSVQFFTQLRIVKLLRIPMNAVTPRRAILY